MNVPQITVWAVSVFLTSFRSTGILKPIGHTELLEIFQWIQFHAVCHCFGSQRSTVLLLLPSLTLICCGIRARGWAPRCFISVSMDIIMLERATYPSVLLLDSGRHRPCSVKLQSEHFRLDISSFFLLAHSLPELSKGRCYMVVTWFLVHVIPCRDLVWKSSCYWIHWAGVER